jgi:hypothetical protein
MEGSSATRRHRIAASWIVAAMIVLAFSLWTVIPFGWIWIGSKISTTQAPSSGPYMVVFFGIVISIVLVAVMLSWLNGIFARLMGSTEIHLERVRLVRSLSDERRPHRNWSVMEVVIVASLAGAVLAMGFWFFVLAGSPLPSA